MACYWYVAANAAVGLSSLASGGGGMLFAVLASSVLGVVSWYFCLLANTDEVCPSRAYVWAWSSEVLLSAVVFELAVRWPAIRGRPRPHSPDAG